MDNFALTKGGQEFLYGTMPRLTKNIEALTAAVNSLSTRLGPAPIITRENTSD